MDSLLSFPVGLFHPLQHAGLSRRSPSRRLTGNQRCKVMGHRISANPDYALKSRRASGTSSSSPKFKRFSNGINPCKMRCSCCSYRWIYFRACPAWSAAAFLQCGTFPFRSSSPYSLASLSFFSWQMACPSSCVNNGKGPSVYESGVDSVVSVEGKSQGREVGNSDI